MPRALVRVVGSDSGALSLTAVQAAVTKKTKAASAFAFASFATASFEEVERTEGVAQDDAIAHAATQVAVRTALVQQMTGEVRREAEAAHAAAQLELKEAAGGGAAAKRRRTGAAADGDGAPPLPRAAVGGVAAQPGAARGRRRGGAPRAAAAAGGARGAAGGGGGQRRPRPGRRPRGGRVRWGERGQLHTQIYSDLH